VPAGIGTVAVSIVEPPFKPPQEWQYDPVALTVNVGEAITWTNTGAVLHTVTADDGRTFDSGNLNPKATFTFTPRQAGSIAYHCTLHPWMKGIITVQP
jgi:nitrite reductase (NO-forming)